MVGFPPAVWLAVGIVIMGLEIVVPGFVIFWFGLGGVLTAFFVFIRVLVTPESQWLFFFVSSLFFLGLWWLVLKRFFKSRNAKDDARDPTLTSLKGKAVSKIEPNIPGKVELYESYHSLKLWKAESKETIIEGEEINVLEANGITLVVEKLKK